MTTPWNEAVATKINKLNIKILKLLFSSSLYTEYSLQLNVNQGKLISEKEDQETFRMEMSGLLKELGKLLNDTLFNILWQNVICKALDILVYKIVWIVCAFWLVNKCDLIALWSTKMTLMTWTIWLAVSKF